MKYEFDKWHVYSYCFLDDLSFIQVPSTINEQWKNNSPFSGINNLDDVLELVKKRFIEEGWEGDGEIGLIWIPPFVDIGFEDTHGTYIWHVKQYNNGISWLLSPIKLDFQRIEKQNPWEERLLKEGWIPENIVNIDIEPFLQEMSENKELIVKQVNSLASIFGEKEDEKEIIIDLLKHRQGQIVARFYSLLDYCYLRFLHSVLLENNPHGIKLQKTSVSLSLASYQPLDRPHLENSETWTLTGLITDLWNAYKFEPASRKLDMLFKSVDFTLNADIKRQINKHIEIRNCVQHHESRLIPDSLKRLGLQNIVVKSSDERKPITIKEWKKIILTDVEILDLCNNLISMAQEFSNHIDVRIPARAYSKPKKEES